MSATDSEVTSMEEPHLVKEEEGGSTNTPSSPPPSTVPSSAPDPATTRQTNIPSEAMIEEKAVSVASNDCSSALSSPAEASSAKPAATWPAAFEGSVEASPATSHIASASDSLTCTETSIVTTSALPLSPPPLPSTTYGGADQGKVFPAVLTFKGVSVTLENNSVWKQFHSCGTEMILTKQGRRMFPYCRYRLSGLDPRRKYSLVLSIFPSDQYRYRWGGASKWEVNGPAEHQHQGLIRAYSHHHSPSLGSEWMGSLVSFYKLKLTNHSHDEGGHIILHSMHRYIPRLHVIPVPDGVAPTPYQPVVMGPESMTFTFPQTEFMAVTTYQNFRITQLKINHNPFAKGFREDGHNSRLNRIVLECRPGFQTQLPVLKPAESSENKVVDEDLSPKNPSVPASCSSDQETRLVLKPIMSTSSSSKDEPFVPCIRGKHALGELVLVQQRPLVEPKEETHPTISVTPASPASTPGSSPGYRKRRKRINRGWANSRGSLWKAATASPTVFHSPSLTVAMQPELDNVEGLQFVSFTSKEALEVHVRDKPATSTPSAPPVPLTTPRQWKEKMEGIPETDEEEISRWEAALLPDLRALKHRQVIHPVLQEVGLKLSSLDPTSSIDLRYLGIQLPLPPPKLPEQGNATAPSPGDEGSPFISRTGKTSDVTKIKGWKDKFIRNKETSPNCDGSQKNLSAFCSNMLDEYLESEAQYISERAAAFSTNSQDPVAYQLPVKSSSYVKTLDSVLQHRKAASRPCPLSHKPLLYSALASPAPPLPHIETSVQAVAPSTQQPAPPPAQPATQSLLRLPTYSPGMSQRPAVSSGQSQGMPHRPSGLTKSQVKLLEMECGALNQGLSRTQLTPDRLSVALSGLLTKQMLPSQLLKVTQWPEYKSAGPECGQEFCRLGCVCSSLQALNRAPFHCRRPECMFGCDCFKREISKQLSALETESFQPIYSMTNMQHMVQPRPSSHSKKLWDHNVDNVDPEPLLIPKSAPLSLIPAKVIRRPILPRPPQPQVREEEKDPVYKYLESMMTCARVREFNSKPPPEVAEPKVMNTAVQNTTAIPQKAPTDNLPKNYHRALLTVKKTEKPSQGIASSEKGAKKQIEIQSACQWNKDRKMVLEALCQRMNQNRLSRLFWVGPYCIRPVAKIFMRKPSGSIVTYRVHISKPSKASENDEDEDDDSDEERCATKSLDEDEDADEDDGQNEEMRFGVTPFLTGVLPAGRLRAKTKPVGCQASGLIQVNGKSYNQARLLLGSMGSLHPANRLAAFVTGRLHPPGGISLKVSRKSNPSNKIASTGVLHVKAAGTMVPPVITARKTAELKTSAQPPAQPIQSDSWSKEYLNLPQRPLNPSAANPFSSGSFQNSSTSSPVSLTVSPSLKTPSFLGQSGTYSFRICPPANQGTRDQNLPGVTLPGGFTLIQLPKTGADGAASESANTVNMAAVDKDQTRKDALDAFTAIKQTRSRPVEPGPSTGLMSSIDKTKGSQVESNLDNTSEDLSSDSDCSESCSDSDENDELVDIETVEEGKQGMAIAQMREAVCKALKESGDSSDSFGSTRDLNLQNIMSNDQCKDKKRRTNHTALERRRRTEQRTLFDKLQIVLRSDPRVPRLTLLSLAVKEVKSLVETSRRLEEQKRILSRMQSLYVKELSLLSGKSDTLIRNKMKEICERQKMREKQKEFRPFFSSLLQTRAALLQAAASQSKPESKLQPLLQPLLNPDFCMAPAQARPPTTAAQDRIMSLLQANLQRASAQPSVVTAVSKSASFPVTTASIQGSQKQMIPGAPTQVSKPTSQMQLSVTTAATPPVAVATPPVTTATPLVTAAPPVTAATPPVTAATPLVTAAPPVTAATPPVTAPTPVVTAATPVVTAAPPVTAAAQDGASPTSSKPPVKHQSFSLPLIRSKTGRIILPSSLRPLGQGLYTLMVMKPREEVEASVSATKQPSDVNQDKSASENDHRSDSGSSCILEENKTVQSSDSKPVSLAELNKSGSMPSLVLKAVDMSQERSTDMKKPLPTACSSVKLTPNPPAESDLSPPVVSRRRGRPRKYPIPPVDANEKHPVVEDPSKSVSQSETLLLVEETQSGKLTSEVIKRQAEDSPGVVSDSPVPVKRRRGRPPKKKSTKLWSPPPSWRGRSPSKSNEDSPVRRSSSLKSPEAKLKESPAATTLHGDTRTTRPLTRGSLGKDFPSAKKRSWIDLEKELEPELGSDPESYKSESE